MKSKHWMVPLCAFIAACSDGASTPTDQPDDSLGMAARGGAAGSAGAGDASGGISGGSNIGGGGSGGFAGAMAGTSAIEGGAGGAQDDGGARCGSDLPRVQSFDAARAARGEALFDSGTLTSGVVPELVFRNLWVAWGVAPPATDEEFWQQASVRYGLTRAPDRNGGWPLGLARDSTANVAFNCLLCHSSNIAGTVLVGAANHRVDLESLFDDLLLMRDLAPMLGLPLLPVPFELDGFTHAAGAQDAFGLGFRLTGMGQGFGPQRAPAWWQLHYKERAFADGGGDARSHRSTMATLVAFGVTPDQLIAREEDFIDVFHYLLSLEPPCWSLTTLDVQRVERGQAVFDAQCATCHGVHSGSDASYPNRVVTLDMIGTDPIRAQRFTPAEAAGLNASWFGTPPFEATGGYLAPPLAGIWARAPYFHNGSVPDLAGVLDPGARPAMWRRLEVDGSDYDPARVGLRYEVVSSRPDPSTREGRLVYDTAREGMDNGGHDFAASLSAEDRADLLEYLRSL
jgi:mono/diheme cytochrome c family protein